MTIDIKEQNGGYTAEMAGRLDTPCSNTSSKRLSTPDGPC